MLVIQAPGLILAAGFDHTTAGQHKTVEGERAMKDIRGSGDSVSNECAKG